MEQAGRATASKAFYTELPKSDFDTVVEHHKRLDGYIDKFDNRLKYAKWKQELVLMYNYEPLASIVKKTEEVKKQYLKKIREENDSNERMYNTDKIMADLSTFKAFSEKLKAKELQLQLSIDEWEMKKKVLNAELADKKTTLKKVLDENYKMNTELLKTQGIKTKGDVVVALRKKALSLRAFSGAVSTGAPQTSTTTRKASNPLGVTQSVKKQPGLVVPLGLNRLLFEECFDILIKNIRSMNSSEDIQQGIFLDLVARQKSKSVMGLNPKPSGKGSMIYDILLHSYTQKKKKQFAFDFAIEWQTFRRFNWRQMLGVMLMHEGSYETFKLLAKTWN